MKLALKLTLLAAIAAASHYATKAACVRFLKPQPTPCSCHHKP